MVIQHHIKYQHLLKKKYVCPHPTCGRLFRLQKQLLRHAKHHTGAQYKHTGAQHQHTGAQHKHTDTQHKHTDTHTGNLWKHLLFSFGLIV